MAVYVDPLVKHGWQMYGRSVGSCHLFADNYSELMAFAGKIELPENWLQGGKGEDGIVHLFHFDLTRSMRQKAIAAGAVQLDARHAAKTMRQLTESMRKGGFA